MYGVPSFVNVVMVVGTMLKGSRSRLDVSRWLWMCLDAVVVVGGGGSGDGGGGSGDCSGEGAGGAGGDDDADDCRCGFQGGGWWCNSCGGQRWRFRVTYCL